MSLAWWKRELFGGWTHFEAVWLLMFLGIQAVVFVFNPDSWLASIAAVTGILCVVFVGKGKISNYLFGLISVSLYAYVSYTFKLYGEMMLNLFVYVPVQFIGFAMWRRHMTDQNTVSLGNAEEVKAKALTVRQWLWVVALTVYAGVYRISALYRQRAAGIGRGNGSDFAGGADSDAAAVPRAVGVVDFGQYPDDFAVGGDVAEARRNQPAAVADVLHVPV